MNGKKALAVRRKVSSLLKGKIAKYLREGGDTGAESVVVEDVLLYWTKDTSCYKEDRYSMLAGYECGRGGIGRGLFSFWWSDGRWDAEIKDICPRYLNRELEELLEEVNGEKEEEN